MIAVLHLAWRYVAYNRLKTGILVISLSISMCLPIAVTSLVQVYESSLIARSNTTPLLLGAKGNRYDLVLKSLYFTPHRPDPITWSAVDELLASGRCIPVPLHLDFTADGRPVVGTSHEYFQFRGLTAAKGRLPIYVGEVAIGAAAARRLGKGTGDYVLTDQASLYDLASVYPLKMKITGVLAANDSPDDEAIFTDFKTTWVIDGIGHGHIDMKDEDRQKILKRDERKIIASAAVAQYTEITEQNIQSFHFHGDRSNFPITSIIVLPDSEKSATLLTSRFNASETVQMLSPRDVVHELLGIVFQVKRFFDANFALVAVGTGLFTILTVLLSMRIRQREMETLFKIGCSRMTIFWLQASELIIVLVLSLVLAVIAATITVLNAPQILT